MKIDSIFSIFMISIFLNNSICSSTISESTSDLQSTIATQIKKLKKHRPVRITKPAMMESVSVTTPSKNKNDHNAFTKTTIINTKNSPLSQAEKSELFAQDKRLNNAVNRFAKGLSENVMHSQDMQHVKTLSDPEKEAVIDRYIAARQQAHREDLSLQKKHYMQALSNFHNNILPSTIKKIKNLEHAIVKNNGMIKKLEEQLESVPSSNPTRKHIIIELKTLKMQNNGNLSNLNEHLQTLHQQLQNLDDEAINANTNVNLFYIKKDQTFIEAMQAINNPVELKIHYPASKEKAEHEIQTLHTQIENDVVEPFKPEIPLDILAANPLLDTFIENIEQGLESEKMITPANKKKIAYLKNMLTYYTKAQELSRNNVKVLF